MSEKNHYCFEYTKAFRISADYQTNLRAMGQNLPKANLTQGQKHSVCVSFLLYEKVIGLQCTVQHVLCIPCTGLLYSLWELLVRRLPDGCCATIIMEEDQNRNTEILCRMRRCELVDHSHFSRGGVACNCVQNYIADMLDIRVVLGNTQ